MAGPREVAGVAEPEISVRVPGLLTRFTGGQRDITVRAATVAESVDRLLETYPALRPHLLDARGQFRPHVKLFHGGTEVTEADGADIALADGDEVVVLQAVSGG